MANKSTTVKLTLKITSFVLRLLLNIIFYTLVVIVIINASKMAFKFAYQLYGPDTVDAPGSGRRIILQIKKGDSSMDVAKKLQNVRAIKNEYSFYLKTKLQNYVIMPGTYELRSDMTYKEILAVITDYSASIVKEDDSGTEGTDSSGTDTGTNTDNSSSNTGTNSGTNSD